MLDTGVLVLNRVYQPVHITSVRRAFSLLYQGAAKAIDFYKITHPYKTSVSTPRSWNCMHFNSVHRKTFVWKCQTIRWKTYFL